jgi:tetratricopeptide (TPR) repeat protein
MTTSPFSASHSPLEHVARFSLLAVVALAPIFFIPSALVSFSFTKVVLILSATFIAFLCFLLARLKEGMITFPRVALFAAPWGIVGAYIVSGIFSGKMGNAFFGLRFEGDTVAFLFTGALLFSLTALLFDSKKKVLEMHFAFLIAFALVALFEALHLFFGPSIFSFGIFTHPISNLIGSWNDLAIFFGLVAVLSLLHIEALAVNQAVRLVLSAAFLVSLFFLMVINFSPVFVMTALFGLGLFVYRFLFRLFDAERSTSSLGIMDGFSHRIVPVFALLLLAVSVLFIVAGDSLNSFFVRSFNTAQLEARPSWQSTIEIAGATYEQDPIFGSGPNTFSEQWNKFHPVETNHTPFWNVDFASGIGVIPTSFVTAGLVGGIAWLVFLALFLWTGIRALVVDPIGDRFAYHLTLSSFLAALYLWLLSIVYVPGEMILALAFLFSGLFVASLLAYGNFSRMWSFTFTDNPRIGFVSILLLSAGLLIGLSMLYVVGEKYLASLYFSRAIAAVNTTGNLEESERLLGRALVLSGNDQHYRFATELYLVRLNSIVSSQTLSEDEARAQFQATLGKAIESGLSATTWNPDDYQNWMALGRVYQSVVPLQIRGAYESAKDAFEKAGALNPSSPLVSLSLAQLSAQNGDATAARVYIGDALRKKNDYTDAIFLLSQIEISEGKLSDAISSVEAATVLEPTNAVVFFQLGLLRYGTNDVSGAIEALERAEQHNFS